MQQLATKPGKEGGATLIVALIMLVLISLIGVASLKGATVAEKMSSADHQKNITFQASESAATVVLRDDSNITKTIIAGVPVDANPYDIGSPETVTQVTLTPAGKGALLGSSIGPGGSSGQRIMVTSNAQLTADQNAATRIVQGVVRIVPNL